MQLCIHRTQCPIFFALSSFLPACFSFSHYNYITFSFLNRTSLTCKIVNLVSSKLGTWKTLCPQLQNKKVMKKCALTLFLLLFSIVIYSQKSGTSSNTSMQNEPRLITLQKLVDIIKSEEKSLQNVEAVNVMVNDMLIENLQDYMINPKNIAQQEVLVLNVNGVNSDATRASIIINTINSK